MAIPAPPSTLRRTLQRLFVVASLASIFLLINLGYVRSTRVGVVVIHRNVSVMSWFLLLLFTLIILVILVIAHVFLLLIFFNGFRADHVVVHSHHVWVIATAITLVLALLIILIFLVVVHILHLLLVLILLH